MLNELPLPLKVSTEPPIGAVFTPAPYVRWVIDKWHLSEAWASGASFLDPTAGEGIFLTTLIEMSLERGFPITESMFASLYAAEIHPPFFQRMRDRLQQLFERAHLLRFPEENFLQVDYLLASNVPRVDYILGNPPWKSFSELPEKYLDNDQYKETVKLAFLHYGMVTEKSNMLLGNSRMDIASLITMRALYEHLKPSGAALLYLPMSLFLNSGAHSSVQQCSVLGRNYAVETFYDFNKERVFPGVSTRYVLAAFRADEHCRYPVTAHYHNGNHWEKKLLSRSFSGKGPLVLTNPLSHTHTRIGELKKMDIYKEELPRQGANTAGANKVFHFSHDLYGNFVSGNGQIYQGSASLLYLLAPNKIIPFPNWERKKFILVPYDHRGKALPADILSSLGALEYFEDNKEILQKRKGVYISNQIRRGNYWALLGVGPYSFSHCKIFWTALGSSRFYPEPVYPSEEEIWQGNQAHHVTMSFQDAERCETVLSYLRSDQVRAYMESSAIAGSRSFAQPGRIRELFQVIR